MDKNRPTDQEENRFVGPFTVEQSGLIGFVIRDEYGAVFAWVLGEANACRVASSLNLAYDCGLLN